MLHDQLKAVSIFIFFGPLVFLPCQKGVDESGRDKLTSNVQIGDKYAFTFENQTIFLF